MTEVFSLRETGLGEIMLGLKNFDNKVQRQMASASLRVGAKIIQKGTKQNIHNVTGATSRAVKVRAGKSTKNYKAIQVVVGSGWFTGDEWYAAFVEFGHKQGKRQHHETKARKARRIAAINNPGSNRLQVIAARTATKIAADAGRKQIPGEHFMEYAYDELHQQAINATIDDFAQRVKSATPNAR